MLFTLDKCQLCGSSHFLGLEKIRVKVDTRKASLNIPEDATSWFICQKCSFIFQNPRLEETFVKEWYARSAYHLDATEISQGQIGHTLNQFVRFEAYLYLNGIRIADLKGATCMDYGCGIGAALNVLAERGNDVWGVELDRREVDFGRKNYPKVNFVHAVEEMPPGLKFDFIFTHHCIEHVYDPNEFFSFAANHLKEGGIMLIVVPAWRNANTLRAYNGFSLSDNSMFDHVSMAGFLNKHGLYQISHLYQNSEDWEMAVIARKSAKKNLYAVAMQEIFAELYENIPLRDAERVRDGDGRHRDPIIVRQ